MKRNKKSPIERRREQIANQLQTLDRNKKSRRNFKSDEAFDDWAEKNERKLRELGDEIAILDNPSDYNELPLAIAAVELGATLDEMIRFIHEELIEPSFCGEYQAGYRVTRDELGRAIDAGTEELRRLANKSPDETFREAIDFLRGGDVAGAERCLERLERFGYVDPYWMVCYAAIQFVRGDYEGVFREIPIGLESFDRERDARAVSAMQALKEAIEPIEPKDHLAAVIRERILAVADGKKLKPYEETYSRYQATEFPSKMNENQRRAMFFSTVVMKAIDRHRFTKELQRRRGFTDETRETEIERVIRNAIYTALEAEDSYERSPSSKFFVDRFVDLLPRRWSPAEVITFLPAG